MQTILERLKEAEIALRECQSMRLLQKRYFQAAYERDDKRKAEVLPQSKLQEKKVDRMIEEYFKPKNELF